MKTTACRSYETIATNINSGTAKLGAPEALALFVHRLPCNDRVRDPPEKIARRLEKLHARKTASP